MAFLDQSFSIADLPTASSFDPLPAGWYTATVTGAEIKNTKAGSGQYIAIKYTITGPTHQGRTIFGNLNIKNPNVKAEEIGRKQLGEIMRATGLVKVTDTDQLIGGNLSIKLEIKNSEQYGESNEIKQFKSVAEAAGATPMPIGFAAAVAPTEPAPPTRVAPPWGKK